MDLYITEHHSTGFQPDMITKQTTSYKPKRL